MELDVITFETAKLLKKCGFPQDLFNTGWYNRIGRHLGNSNILENGDEVISKPSIYSPDAIVDKKEYEIAVKLVYLAPTQSLAYKWLREVHNIKIDVTSSTHNMNKKWVDWHCSVDNHCVIDHRDGYDTFEFAFEKGLIYALNKVLNENINK